MVSKKGRAILCVTKIECEFESDFEPEYIFESEAKSEYEFNSE